MGDGGLVESVAKDIVKGLLNRPPRVIVISGGDDFVRDEVIEGVRRELKFRYNGQSEKIKVKAPDLLRQYRPRKNSRLKLHYQVSLPFLLEKYSSVRN